MSISENLFNDKSTDSLSGKSPKKRWFKKIGFLINVFALFFNTGCLEIPQTPDESLKVKNIGIWMIKENLSDSLYFKSNFNESFTLKAFANPDIYTDELEFYWYRDKKKIAITKEIHINTPFTEEQVPNGLKAIDSKKNELFYDFQVYLNHSPTMKLKTTPNDQDTLYGSSSTAFLFSWSSDDKDVNDSLIHYIKIDNTTYFTGPFTSIQQSGFNSGVHSFSIWVIDSFGDADTLDTRTFVVIDSSGVSK